MKPLFAPAYRFPAPVDDVESVIRYAQSHAAEYKVDLKRVKELALELEKEGYAAFGWVEQKPAEQKTKQPAAV